MAAYAISGSAKVHDPDKLRQYGEQVAPLIERMGGRYRVLSRAVEVAEGNWRPETMVIIEFDSMEQLHAWYDAAEYQPLKRLRHDAVDADLVFVDGIP